VTTILPRARWQSDDDNDRREDDLYRDAACRGADPELFFPVGRYGEEEPAIAPPEVKKICHRCPVAGQCLDRFGDEEFGVYAGTTGYERQLLRKKIVRKQCVRCQSTDVVKNNTQKKEVCLACGLSWDIL
jgi:WhiB family redox-sensing transcriptional regulator